jgi:hypothetical protein
VEYAFLADFDILWDTSADIQSRPRTRPAYRLAMDRYFKILRAREEIKRLNVEIPRVVTWIVDENRVLCRAERVLRKMDGKSDEEIEVDIRMAVQLALYRERRGRFDDGHMRRFWVLAKTPGFTASLRPGVSLEQLAVRRALQEARDQLARVEDEMEVDETVVVDAAASGWRRDEDDEWEDADEREEEDRVRAAAAQAAAAQESDDEGEGEDAKEREVSGLMYRISMLAVDGGGIGSRDEA